MGIRIILCYAPSAMTNSNATPPPKPPPQAVMLDLLIGYWVSKMVHVVARLGIADLLADGPRTAAELAQAAGADARSLYRVLRALAGAGLFVERDGRFELTPLGATLRSGVPGSMRAFALMMPDSFNWRAWDDLQSSVKTGGIAFDQVHGVKFFEYLESHPDLAKVFGESMGSLSEMENPAVAVAGEFSRVRTLMDVGGGHGSLLAAILRANPGLRGILLDLPGVVERAKKDVHVTAPDVAERIELRTGDFFESVPEGADACVMKYILHDWDDERCTRILRNCHRALPREGKVFVVDTVIPPGNDPHWGKLLDINMLVLTGGRERTEAEFREMFGAAGFRLARVIPTACPLSVVEGVKA